MHNAPQQRGNLLCVANFRANVGFAWDFIEGVYGELANRLALTETATYVAYPSIPSPPKKLMGTAARPVVLDASLRTRASINATVDFVKRNDIRTIYLTDRPVWSLAYRALRRAGVQRIVVHDHTSGARTEPKGLKRYLKRLRQRIPGTTADMVVGVSDYVAQRVHTVGLVPWEQLKRIWNGIEIPPFDPSARQRLQDTFGLSPDRPVVLCACRAVPEKGVHHLLHAFEHLIEDGDFPVRPVLVYIGAGPDFERLSRLRDQLKCHDDIIFAGYRPDARDLAGGADICVVPSIWQEAFGLSALEPMARGVPVIASAIGGIPEIVVNGETGLLVPPGDELALAETMKRLLSDGSERARLSAAGRIRAREQFSIVTMLDELTEVIAPNYRLSSAQAALSGG